MRVPQVERWEEITEIKFKKKGELCVVSFRSLLITQAGRQEPWGVADLFVCVRVGVFVCVFEVLSELLTERLHLT